MPTRRTNFLVTCLLCVLHIAALQTSPSTFALTPTKSTSTLVNTKINKPSSGSSGKLITASPTNLTPGNTGTPGPHRGAPSIPQSRPQTLPARSTIVVRGITGKPGQTRASPTNLAPGNTGKPRPPRATSPPAKYTTRPVKQVTTSSFPRKLHSAKSTILVPGNTGKPSTPQARPTNLAPGNTGKPGQPRELTPGACEFPSAWQQGLRWWRGYVAITRDGDEQKYRNYEYDIFSQEHILAYEQLYPNQIKRQYKCVAAGRVGNTYAYLMQYTEPETGIQRMECRQYAYTDGVLLLRTINPGAVAFEGQAGLQNCVDIMDAQRLYEVLPSFDPDTGELPVKRCPFTQAIYQTQVTVQTPNGVGTYCTNVPDSRVVVKAATVDVQSCRKVDTYDEPFFSTLYCVADWEGSIMSDKFGAQAASDRSILLMYDTTNSGDRPHFYVAKYRKEGHILKLNLYVANRHSIEGRLSATADNHGESFKQLLMTMTETVPTMSELATKPTKLQDECGGCLNGLCQLNSGSYQCICKLGFGGLHCNQGLPSGSCWTKLGDNPCKNGGVCEQHGQYYHCRCNNNYIGFHCEVPKYCSPDPCQHGECQASLGGYHCLCPDGYSGRTCSQHVVLEAEEDKRILIILSSLLSTLAVAIAIVTIIICQCKRKHSDKNIPKNPDGDLPNQTYSSMTSWFPDYKRELAEQEETTVPL